MANQKHHHLKNKTIYILRHGETDFNKKGLVQGRGVNASLNEKGRLQASQVCDYLKGDNIDHIYTSSLKRTEETVASLIAHGIQFTSLEGFDEISWGNQEGVQASIEDKAVYADTLAEWRKGNLDLSVGGGESPNQVMKRQKEAMEIVLASEHDNILICMHGRALRILLCWMLNYPLNFMDGFPHQNCGYYKLKSDGNSFTIISSNKDPYST